MIDIRQPNISAGTQSEQLLQMRSYLYQLAQQLNWAFSAVSQSGGSTAPAPSGNTRINPQKTFDALKSLIIKSADIVNAYYEEINKKLEGVYVAQSDFGIYSEKTAGEIRANSTGIEQLFSNNRAIVTTVDTLEGNLQNASNAVNSLSRENSELAEEVGKLYAATVETKAYVKTGLLYEDDHGAPVYGLEIGQTNDVNGENVFSKFARFSSDRLSFYDRNDTEVAYISDYRLYITNAEITGTLTLANKFKIYYKDGLAFQWIGGAQSTAPVSDESG